MAEQPEPQIDGNKYIRQICAQRESALNQAAELAVMLEAEQESNESLTKELDIARAEIERLEQQVAKSTPRSSSRNGKEEPAESSLPAA